MAAFEYRQAQEIRDVLARHGVRYLFIGKSGAILLGFPDTTQDADLFVERSAENGRALAAALNDDQCSGMQEFWGWYLEKSGIPMPPGPADFADNRQHLRLWAALSPAQKRAALAGAILPVAQMNGLQQRGKFQLPQ